MIDGGGDGAPEKLLTDNPVSQTPSPPHTKWKLEGSPKHYDGGDAERH